MTDRASTRPTSSFASDRDSFVARRVEQNRRDSAPVLLDLRRLGYELEWISELFNRPFAYEDAIPVLLEWMPKITNEAVKEAIVRALSVKWAKPAAAAPLIKEFPHADKFALKWAIGNALDVVADDSVFEDIERLLSDPAHGRSRQMLVAALGNMENPCAFDLALTFLTDGEFAGYAAQALGKLKHPRARPYLEPLLEHPDSWTRREAKRALGKIETAERRRALREAKRRRT